MKKILLTAALAIVAVIIVIALGLWLFFDANQLRPRLETAMGGAVGRKVALGNIHLSLLSGSVAVDDVQIGDDPAFGAEPFVTAQSVSVGVDLWPLITSRDVRVESFSLDRARVRLVRSASGTWNFASLGGARPSTTTPTTTPSAVAGALVREISITNGQLLVQSGPAGAKSRVYDAVTAEIRNLSLTSTFPFELTAKTPGGGSLEVKGEAGPIDQADASATPFQAKVTVTQLDITSTGFIDPASGLSGAIDFSGTASSSGRALTSTGTLHATRARLVAGGSAARVPIDVAYESTYTPRSQRGALKRGEVRVGKAVAQLTGNYSLAGETPAIEMKLSGRQMPITELEAALPAAGVTLPSGATMKQGTVATDLDIRGAIDRLVIAGPVTLSNAVVSGFDLGANLQAISALAGLPPSGQTAIETLACRLRVAPQGIRVDDLNLVAPSIGTMTGSGTIAANSALDFAMLVKPAASRGAAGGAARIVSLGQPANGVPLKVAGTTSKPVFTPDVSRAVQNVLKSDETKKKAADVLGSIFGRKKK